MRQGGRDNGLNKLPEGERIYLMGAPERSGECDVCEETIRTESLEIKTEYGKDKQPPTNT